MNNSDRVSSGVSVFDYDTLKNNGNVEHIEHTDQLELDQDLLSLVNLVLDWVRTQQIDNAKIYYTQKELDVNPLIAVKEIGIANLIHRLSDRLSSVSPVSEDTEQTSLQEDLVLSIHSVIDRLSALLPDRI